MTRTQDRRVSSSSSLTAQRDPPAATPGPSQATMLDAELRLHERIVERDRSAVLECVDRIGDLVYSTALLHTGDVPAAEDLTERLFLELWREPATFHPSKGPIALQLIRRMGREPSRHQQRDGSAAAAARTRVVVLSSLIGCFLSVIVVTAGVALSGGGAASIGAGMMVGAFDGLPFGAMVGAMVAFGKSSLR